MSSLKKVHGKNVAFKTKSYLPCGTKFFRIGGFLCFAGTNSFAITIDWFFLLGIYFAIFREVPSTQH